MNAKVTPKLYGWKDIATYLGCSMSTAKRYFKKMNLPVRYIGKKPTANPTTIDIWIEKNSKRTPA